MPLPTISGEFLVVGDPVLRHTPDGTAVVNLRLKAASRKEEPKGSGNWVDKDVLWANATAWRDLATHITDSIKDRDLIVVTGEIYTREFVDPQTNMKKVSTDIHIRNAGPSLAFRTTPHGAGQQAQTQAPQGQQAPPYGGQQAQAPAYGGAQAPAYGGGQPGYAQPQPGYAPQPQQGDPWAQPQPQQAPGNNPPF